MWIKISIDLFVQFVVQSLISYMFDPFINLCVLFRFKKICACCHVVVRLFMNYSLVIVT